VLSRSFIFYRMDIGISCYQAPVSYLRTRNMPLLSRVRLRA
jgi:hypothetical protein